MNADTPVLLCGYRPNWKPFVPTLYSTRQYMRISALEVRQLRLTRAMSLSEAEQVLQFEPEERKSEVKVKNFSFRKLCVGCRQWFDTEDPKRRTCRRACSLKWMGSPLVGTPEESERGNEPALF